MPEDTQQVEARQDERLGDVSSSRRGESASGPYEDQCELISMAHLACLTPGLTDTPAERLAESCTIRGARTATGGAAASTSRAAQASGGCSSVDHVRLCRASDEALPYAGS